MNWMTRLFDVTSKTVTSSERIAIKTMTWLHQQGNVSTQFDCVKVNILGLGLGPTNVGILGRDFFNEPRKLFVKRKQFQTTWNCFLAHTHIFVSNRMSCQTLFSKTKF